MEHVRKIHKSKPLSPDVSDRRDLTRELQRVSKRTARSAVAARAVKRLLRGLLSCAGAARTREQGVQERLPLRQGEAPRVHGQAVHEVVRGARRVAGRACTAAGHGALGAWHWRRGEAGTSPNLCNHPPYFHWMRAFSLSSASGSAHGLL